MEADKSQDLQGEPANWRPRRAKGVALTQGSQASEASDPGRTHAWLSVGGQAKTNVTAQSQSGEGISSCLSQLSLFVLLWASNNWMRPTHIKEDNLLDLVYQSKG